jgi:hypothetical protein
MTTLITLSDIEAIESISVNVDFNKKLRPHVFKAQEFEVRPLIGEEFWIYITANVATLGDLLNEKTYSYNNKTYQHPGLKAVIIMYTLARYKSTIGIHDTAFGLVQKTNQYSEPVSDKLVARESAKETAGAEVYWLRVRDYLDRNKATYPLWKSCNSVKLTGNGLRIRKASKP